jgi:hypothetical protein
MMLGACRLKGYAYFPDCREIARAPAIPQEQVGRTSLF